jgi:hypothetical protein
MSMAPKTICGGSGRDGPGRNYRRFLFPLHYRGEVAGGCVKFFELTKWSRLSETRCSYLNRRHLPLASYTTFIG